MKSGFVKRLLSIVLAVALVSGHVMPVMAEGSATVGGNSIVDTEVSAEETQEEEKAVQDIVTAGVAQDIVVNDAAQETVVEETVLETEISTEESTEEVVETEEESISENEISEEATEETTEEADDSVSANEIPDEEVPLAGALIVSLEPVTVNGITITVSGPASAFAEGTTVSAVEVEPAEVVIEAVQESEQAEVIRLKVFDINLVCNGEFVQPLNGEEITVNFEGDLLIQDEEDEEIVVYHVDGEESVTKMETEASIEDGSVDMTTTHFSEYAVAVTIPEGFVKVTVNHYLGNEASEANRLFLGGTLLVERGGKVKNVVRRTGDYDVQRIDVVADNSVIDNPANGIDEYSVTTGKDKLTINVYYTAKDYGEVSVPVKFFDYDDEKNPHIGDEKNSTALKSNSINYYKNYASYKPVFSVEEIKAKIKEKNKKNTGENTKSYENRLATIYNTERDKYEGMCDSDKNGALRMSTKGAFTSYTGSINGKKVNAYEGSSGYIVTGLLDSTDPLNLNSTDPLIYNTPKFTFEDPGFFTDQPSKNDTKHIYSNYKMAFERKGTEYTLKAIIQPDGGRWATLKEKFFPLPGGEDNWFFGMRHDFEFKIGDYVGDMEYEFTGDDDLWVILDNKVVLDLGGIHKGKTDKIDVWGILVKNDPKASVSYAEKKAYLTEENQEKTHKITVLYMERGGSESNCNMKFRMPKIVVVPLDNDPAPKTDVELLKIDSVTGDPISGVEFTVYDSTGVACRYPDASDENGKVVIKNLLEGTYTLKETKYNETAYEKNDTIYTIVVSPGAENVTVSGADGKQGNAFVIKNTPIVREDITFYKVDKYSKNPISGVNFTLKKEDINGNVLDTEVSGADGSFVFEDVCAGTYYLQETSSPINYKPAPTKGWRIEVILGENRQLTYAIMGGPTDLWDNDEATGRKLIMNEPYASIVFTKVKTNTEEAIDGATFALYDYSENKKGDSPLKTVTSATVDGNKGTVKFDGLTVGQKYLLEETTPADGYIKPTNPWIVEVVYENGEFVQKIYETTTDGDKTWIIDTTKDVNEDAKIENSPAVGSLTIEKEVTKVDSVHGTAAFIFKIECSDNKTILYRTISFTEAGKKSVKIADLPFGTYKVTELKALRYQVEGESEKEAIINSAAGATVSYTNNKVFEQLYSHTDVMINKITFDSEGVATCNNTDITSTSDSIE